MSTTIGLMEDNRKRRKRFSRFLTERGYSVEGIRSADQAVEFAEAGAVTSFILDINMGSGREQEGLDALERIKKTDDSIPVAIYTSYAEKHHRMAHRLAADVILEKSPNEESDIDYILKRLLGNEMEGESSSDLLEHPPFTKEVFMSDVSDDINVTAYFSFLNDPDWVTEHCGQHIAIVNGALAAIGESRADVLAQVRAEYPGFARFIGKVPGVRTVDLSSPLSIER